MKFKKIAGIIGVLVIMMLVASISIADDAETFAQAKQLIDSKVSCSDLTNDQLEIIGEYYMEQMHPGDAHEAMDQMMGGEGSESLKQMHIAMGLRFYCGKDTANGTAYAGMMNGYGSGMMGRSGVANYNGVSGCGMMGNNALQGRGGRNMMGYGMMGGAGWLGFSLLSILYVAIAAFVFGMIFWWTYKLVIKDKENAKTKGK